jgi:hypothetical protein
MPAQESKITENAAKKNQSGGRGLESLETWSAFFNVSVVVLTALLAVAGFFAWKYTSELGAFKDEALNRFKTESAKELAILQTEAADAKRRQAEAETELVKLRKRQEDPRGVPDRLIADILLTASPAEVILLYHQGSPESRLFASGVHRALSMGGWKVLEVKGVASITERGSGQGDFIFWMRDLEFTSPHMKALEKAFKAAGFNFSGMGDPELPDDTLRIIINPKQ